MAPVDPTTTQRLKVQYIGPFGTHTMLFHAQTGITVGEFVGDVADFIDVAKNIQYDGTVWGSAEYAAAGSAIFLPYAAWVPFTSASGADPDDDSAPSTFLQFGGRTSGTGVRVKLYLFEVAAQTRNDMRYDPGESALVDAIVAELQSVDNNIGAIDGGTPAWKSYVNVGENDFLTHRARR